VKSKKIYFTKIGCALAALALAGCDTVKKEEDASVIKEKAVQRWEFLIAHQAEKAYDFLSPGYRQTKSRDAYAQEMNSRGVRWSKVNYGSQECEADVCKVRLSVDYSLSFGGPAGTVKSMAPLKETWVHIGGKWYFLPDPMPVKPGKDKES